MNKADELIKIQSILKLPITDLNFYPTYVELISGNLNIGNLAYYTASGIIIYDTDQSFLSKLKWFDIYIRDKEEIDSKIFELLEKESDEIEITVGLFRNLYIKNQDGTLLHTINCSFDNGWTVAIN